MVSSRFERQAKSAELIQKVYNKLTLKAMSLILELLAFCVHTVRRGKIGAAIVM